jgi:tRNA A-37 threonylcarbamoyl transferase component Bud32
VGFLRIKKTMSNRRDTLKTQLSLVSRARAIDTNKNKVQEKVRIAPSSLVLKNVEKSAEEYFLDYPHITPTQLDEMYTKFGPNFTQYFLTNYKPSRLLGEGGYGSVLAACTNRYTCVAVKVQQVFSQKDFQREIDMQTKFAMLALAPALNDEARYFEHDGKQFAVLSMETVDGDLLSLLEHDLPLKDLTLLANAITDMIGMLVKHHLTHGDFSVANMAYIYNKNAFSKLVLRPILIDMFWSTDKFSDPEYDTLQMLRTLLPKFTPEINTTARKLLLTHLLKFYTANWGALTMQEIESKFAAKAKVYQEIIENDNTGNRTLTSKVTKSVSTSKPLQTATSRNNSSSGRRMVRANRGTNMRLSRRRVRSFYRSI